MSDIEQQVQQAIEGFGELAYERFRCKVDNGDWHTPLRNDMLLMWLDDDKILTEQKPLPELFEHGVKFYGFEQEKQMWQFKGAGGDWQDIPDHADYRGVLKGMNKGFYQHRRKNSAALLFDLPRAIAGDAVEMFKDGVWIDITPNTVFYERSKPFHENIGVHHGGIWMQYIDIVNLRMKYPKAAI